MTPRLVLDSIPTNRATFDENDYRLRQEEGQYSVKMWIAEVNVYGLY